MVAVTTRGVIQIVLTAMTVATAVTAFAFAFFFQQFMDDLSENIRGAPVSHGGKTYLPCVRATLDTCSSLLNDKCDPLCCPAGYECLIDPIVNLYCQDLQVVCGDKRWCMDYADILEGCPTKTCKEHRRVLRATTWAYLLSATGIFLDLADIVTFLRCPDSIVCKAGLNVFSCLVKFIAFGAVLGAEAAAFLGDLETAGCYNKDGVAMVGDAGGMFLSYATVQVISAILSLTTAPFSAYWGGKLIGVPYVK